MFGTISQVMEEFLLDCQSRGHSRNTLSAYRCAFKSFSSWTQVRSIERVDTLTPMMLREYAAQCLSDVTPGAAHARLRPLKTLLKWAHREEYLTQDVTRRLQLPKLPREPLATIRVTQVRQLLEAVAQHSRHALRDRAILTVLFDTGLRVSELTGLDLEDLRAEGFLVIRRGKGAKSRVVPISRPTVKVIRRYLADERPESVSCPALFLTSEGRMAAATVDKLLERSCKAAGLPRFSAHTFRRGFGVQYLRNGGDVFTLQRIFGHTSLEMSNRYAQLVDDDVKDAHRRASPGLLLSGRGGE